MARVIARRRPAAGVTSPARANSPRRPAHAAAATRPIACAVITVSDTRGRSDDPGGDGLARAIEGAGHRAARRAWVRDEVRAIRAAVRAALGAAAIDAVIVTGGTGIAPRDVTPEALAPLCDRTLAGFGEAFGALSRAQVGSAAWLSRAGAGVARGRLLFWLPGSPRGALLALRELILPELGHALRLLGRLTTEE